RLRETRTGGEEDGCLGDFLGIEVLRLKLPVGSGRTSIEGDRKMVRRPDLAEGRWRRPVLVDREESCVHAFPLEKVSYELAMAIVTDTRDNRGLDAEPRKAGGHVARESAEVAGEAGNGAQRSSQVVRIEVDPDAPHHDRFDHAGSLSHRSTCARLRSSAARTAGRSASVTATRSCSITAQP